MENDTFEHNGRTFTFRTEWDDCGRLPWKDDDGAGIVSEWTSRAKEPGERILCSDRSMHRYYDFAGTMRKAMKDCWGGYDKPKDATKKLVAALAVEKDFERMRRFCNDQWNYVGVIVKDEMTGQVASLWGIESDSGDYVNEVAYELADEMFPLASASEAAALELATD